MVHDGRSWPKMAFFFFPSGYESGRQQAEAVWHWKHAMVRIQGLQGYHGLMPWLALVARRQRARRVHGYREKSRAARGRRSIVGAPAPRRRCGEQGAGEGARMLLSARRRC